MGRASKTLMTLLVGLALVSAAEGDKSASSVARSEASDTVAVTLPKSTASEANKSGSASITRIVTPPTQKSTWTKIKGLFM